MMQSIDITRLTQIDSIATPNICMAGPIGLMREPIGSPARPEVISNIKYALAHSIATQVFLAILHDAEDTLLSPT